MVIRDLSWLGTQAELRETSELVMFEAREAGHVPHPFLFTNYPWGRRTACRRCGALFAVKVMATGVRITRDKEPCPNPLPKEAA